MGKYDHLNINLIETTEEETRTNMPSFVLEKVRPYLTLNHIEYTVYTGSKVPDDWVQGWQLFGHKDTRHLAVVVSHLNSEQLRQMVEHLSELTSEEFAEYIQTLS